MTESYLVADGKHSKQQYNFIKNEIWILSWAAASQRANIFPKNISDEERRSLRNNLKLTLFKILDQFIAKEQISDNILIKKIILLVEKHRSNNFRFNVGHSQKLINISLKYYWCMGWLKNEPPHCPIDRIILTKAGIKVDGKTPSWTKMDNIEDYKSYIKELKNISSPKTIATWELDTFNRRD